MLVKSRGDLEALRRSLQCRGEGTVSPVGARERVDFARDVHPAALLLN